MHKIYVCAVIIAIVVVVAVFYFSGISGKLFVRPAVKPNILLITACSLRQDHLAYHGYSRNTSLNIDELAHTSIVFKDCHIPIPWAKPSLIAMMTGKYPHEGLSAENHPGWIFFILLGIFPAIHFVYVRSVSLRSC